MDAIDSDIDSYDNEDFAGVTRRRTRFQDSNDFAGLMNDEEAIEKIEVNKRKHTKRDRLKAESVRYFQHVAGISSD